MRGSAAAAQLVEEGSRASARSSEIKLPAAAAAAARALGRRRIAASVETRHEMWEKHAQAPEFFANITIACDGGLSEVGQLFSTSRFFFAFLSLAFVVVNVRAVLIRNLNSVGTDVDKWAAEKTPGFLVTDCILDFISIYILQQEQGSLLQRIKPEIIVGVVELLMLSVCALEVLWLLVQGLCSCNPTSRWHAIVYFFWDILPQLSALSAMRALNYVTSSVFVPALAGLITRVTDGVSKRPKTEIAGFFMLRLLALIIGFDAFLVKFRHIAQCAGKTGFQDRESRDNLLDLVVFLNQVLGVVQVKWFVQHRLYSFVFGGESDVLDEKDELLLMTWQAMLAQRIWKTYPCHKYVAVMLTFSDSDFQKLILIESSRSPHRLTQATVIGSAGDLEMAAYPSATESQAA